MLLKIGRNKAFPLILCGISLTACAASPGFEPENRAAFFDLQSTEHNGSDESTLLTYQVFIDGIACEKQAYSISLDSSGDVKASIRTRSSCGHYGSQKLEVRQVDIDPERLKQFDRAALELGFFQNGTAVKERPLELNALCMDPPIYDIRRFDGEKFARIESNGCLMSERFKELLFKFELLIGSELK